MVIKLRNILDLAKNDFKSKYAGNFLGVLWAFLYPCVTIVLYWFVFHIALHSEAEGGVPYILWLVSALVPYLFFCDAIPGAAGAFVDYSYLVEKVRFEVRVLPLVRILSNLIIHLFFIFLLIVMAFALGYFPRTSDLWLVYYIIAELSFVFSIGTLLSVLTVFIRDIRGVFPVLIQVGYWLTPLFWNISSLDFHLSLTVKLINPVTYITEGFRDAMVYGSAPDVWYTLYFWGLTLACGVVALALFKRLKGVIADYV